MDTIDRLELMARRNQQDTWVTMRVQRDSTVEVDLAVGKGVPLSCTKLRLRDALESLLESEDALNKDRNGSPWR